MEYRIRAWNLAAIASSLSGAGSRLCPGKDLDMVKVSTFLHYFVTKYRFVALAH